MSSLIVSNFMSSIIEPYRVPQLCYWERIMKTHQIGIERVLEIHSYYIRKENLSVPTLVLRGPLMEKR